MKILNKEMLFNDCQLFIESNYENNKLSLIECLNLKENITDKIISFISNDDFINNLIFEKDRERLHITLNKNSINKKHFFLSIGIYVKAQFKRIIDIVFPAKTVKEMLLCMDESKYEINFCEESNNTKKPKLLFYRNSLAILPEADLMRKKYNRIKNILQKFRIAFNLFGDDDLADVGKIKVNNKTIFDNDFFTYYLFNQKFPDVNKYFFDNLLKLNALESTCEVFWAFHSANLKRIGFGNKEEFNYFCENIQKIKEELKGIFLTPEFDFNKKYLKLIIETKEKQPYKYLAVRMNIDDNCESLLDKSIYLSGTLHDDVKIEIILLKDYVKNKKETLDIIKLLKY